MLIQYKLDITQKDQNKKIDFANNTNEFVEVVFVIDNKEVKNGQVYSHETRGYCFPPGYNKDIKTMKNGEPLPFGKKGTVKAYIFEGEGKYKERDYSVPAFISRKMDGRKAIFKRLANTPTQVLEMQY